MILADINMGGSNYRSVLCNPIKLNNDNLILNCEQIEIDDNCFNLSKHLIFIVKDDNSNDLNFTHLTATVIDMEVDQSESFRTIIKFNFSRSQYQNNKKDINGKIQMEC